METGKLIVLEQDAGRNCKKNSVEISEEKLIRELKSFFRWRKGNFIKRLYQQGTSDFDRFIEHLFNKGYKKN